MTKKQNMHSTCWCTISSPVPPINAQYCPGTLKNSDTSTVQKEESSALLSRLRLRSARRFVDARQTHEERLGRKSLSSAAGCGGISNEDLDHLGV